MARFTVIDSFSVPDGAQSPLDRIPGAWFVVQPQAAENRRAPIAQQTVSLRLPNGGTLQTRISSVEVRHAAIAVQFDGLLLADVPRLSTFDATVDS